MIYKQKTDQVVEDGYGNATATVVSDVSDLTFMDTLSYQITILSGSASGTYTIQVSNDYDPTKGEGTFVPTTLTLAQTSGSFSGSQPSAMLTYTVAGQYIFPYKYARLSYTNSAGTGTFKVTAQTKGV